MADSTLEEVDNIMAELGLSSEPRQRTTTVSEDDVDSLMAEIGVSVTTGATGTAPSSVGGGRGLSAGPGPGFARGGISSGPGAMARGGGGGGSSGPGPGMARGSAGPGPGMSSGPGGVGRGRPLATHTPDGRPIIHQGPPCGFCGEMVIGQCLNALGKTYHPEHFVCVHCNQPFPGGAFVEHEGQPYCEKDFNELFAPRCASCTLPINDKCVSAGEKKYHPHHFNCAGCGFNLVGKPYKEEDGDIYCTSCKEARTQRVAPKAEPCARCKKPILGEFIILNGQKMHAEHFRCEECRCEFKGGNCHEYEGKLYCTDDYSKLLRNTCASCHKPILGRSITALGRVWHPEHFVCFVCHEPFAGSNFYDHEGKAYCEAHYTQEFGTPCAKCGRPVVNNATHFLDKVYHLEHFVCSGCDQPLKKGDINEWESKPMCMGCYKKLPKEVRKRVEKKREAEKKIAKQRAKEEKAKKKL